MLPLRGAPKGKAVAVDIWNDPASGRRPPHAGRGRHHMAFIRKRGNSYYLVHNVRNKGRVRQIHLACLGRRPRISEEVIQGVSSKHPFVRVDWDELKARTSQTLVRPFENNAQYLRDLLSSVRNLHMDVADLHLPVLGMTHDRELTSQLTAGLKLLRGTLDVKLAQLRKGGIPPFMTKAGRGLR